MSLPSADRERRILLIAPNISRRMGGEGLKALQIHQELRAMGYDVRQIAHARVRDEMVGYAPDLRIDYVEDGFLQILFNRLRAKPLLSLLNAWQLHRLARRVAMDYDPAVVHFTSPISPVLPYFRFPHDRVVIGPLNGNVSHPPAFTMREPRNKKVVRALLLPLQWMLGKLFTGKHHATLLVAGGDRTVAALTLGGCMSDQFVTTLDSGIPDSLFDRPRFVQVGENHDFVYLGRLVTYKACDLAVRAVAGAAPQTTLDIIGDGPERAALEALARDLDVADRVRFLGWMTPGPALYDRLSRYRALVMPSLAEANGIVFQEAMTLGLPVICVDWAGPSELLTKQEAIMIQPHGEAAVVAEITAAMNRLASDADYADALAGHARAKADLMGFRWRDLLMRWQAVYRATAQPKI